MIHKFTCKKCGSKYLINIPIFDYYSNIHKCSNPDCNGELAIDIKDNSLWKCDGAFGKSN